MELTDIFKLNRNELREYKTREVPYEFFKFYKVPCDVIVNEKVVSKCCCVEEAKEVLKDLFLKYDPRTIAVLNLHTLHCIPLWEVIK